MKCSVAIFYALLAILISAGGNVASAGPSVDPNSIVGIWKVADNKGSVEIYQHDGKFFGKIATLTRPNFPDNDKEGFAGKPRTDRYNPEPALRSRSLIGMEFMHDFVYQGKGEWEYGRIYDPETGRTYRCKMYLTADGKLQVHGYYGISLIGRTVTWTR